MSSQNDDWKINGPKAEPEHIPAPTVWPATMALGVTFIAFGVVTTWIMSIPGWILLFFSTAGWIEDMRND